MQAVQKKLNQLHTRLDAETERLCLEQRKKLEAEQAEFDAIITERQKSALLLENNVGDLVIQREDMRKDVLKITASIEELNRELKHTKNDCAIERAKIAPLRQEVESLTSRQAEYQERVDCLQNEEQELKKRIDVLQNVFVEWQDRSASAEVSYKKKIDEKKNLVQILESKILQSNQELEKRHVEELSIRGEFADRERLLNERDKNLRIRETKVEQGEQKMLQNSDLLNL